MPCDGDYLPVEPTAAAKTATVAGDFGTFSFRLGAERGTCCCGPGLLPIENDGRLDYLLGRACMQQAQGSAFPQISRGMSQPGESGGCRNGAARGRDRVLPRTLDVLRCPRTSNAAFPSAVSRRRPPVLLTVVLSASAITASYIGALLLRVV